MFVHEVTAPVAGVEAGGLVPPGRYVDCLEEARAALLASTEAPELHGLTAVVARLEIDYVQPIRAPGDPIFVALRVTHVGRSSFGLVSRLDHGGSVAARSTTVLVAYDTSRHRSRFLTSAERAGLGRFRAGAEE